MSGKTPSRDCVVEALLMLARWHEEDQRIRQKEDAPGARDTSPALRGGVVPSGGRRRTYRGVPKRAITSAVCPEGIEQSIGDDSDGATDSNGVAELSLRSEMK